MFKFQIFHVGRRRLAGRSKRGLLALFALSVTVRLAQRLDWCALARKESEDLSGLCPTFIRRLPRVPNPPPPWRMRGMLDFDSKNKAWWRIGI